jgi:proteasome lid subunit RPN8/RPN11
MITIAAPLLETLVRHGRLAYPREACGALIGTERSGRKTVTAVRPLRNGAVGRERTGFEIDPQELLALERELDPAGPLVVGFYHSHVDRPGHPTPADLEHAWPLYSYVIVTVEGGWHASASSWTRHEKRGVLDEEVLEVSRPAAAAPAPAEGRAEG